MTAPHIPDAQPAYLRYRAARGFASALGATTVAADFHKLPLWVQLELNYMALQLLTGLAELR